MVYIKAVLNDKRPKQDNLYPLLIRITFNRSNTTVTTGLRVKQEDWDKNTSQIKRSNPNFQLLNQKLSEIYFKIQKVALKLEDVNEFSFENLKDGLLEKPKTTTKILTFNEFAAQLITEFLEVKRTGNAVVYKTAVNRLVKHCNNTKLKFIEINYTLLDGFSRKLTMEGVKPNTIGNYFRSIRAIYNRAIKAKLVDRSYYPFTEIKIKTSKTAKRATSQVELFELNRLVLKPGSKEWHARNYFLLSISLVGISFTDMVYLKPENISNGRVFYTRRKTHKHYSIKITKVAADLIKNYTHTGKYVLPVLSANIEEDSLDSKKHIQQFIKTTNKYLSRMGKLCKIDNLTTYVARHTWATTAKRLGYSNELIAESMGHEYGNKITNIYLDSFEQSVIDEVNAKVIDALTS
jgi:integrase/recombinase XerD